MAFSDITAHSESGNRDYYPSGSPVVSSAGARFAMQVLPSTAANPGYGVAPARDQSASEYDRVGREYLGKLQQHYGGDMAKAWAAYNWGPGNVDNALALHGRSWFQALPGGVQGYVLTNLKAAGMM